MLLQYFLFIATQLQTKMENIESMNFPTELRRVLIQFSIAYCIERPDDIINFGKQYFESMKENTDAQDCCETESNCSSQPVSGRHYSSAWRKKLPVSQ